MRRFVVYDFGDGGHSAADLRALYAGVDAELVLVDWAPVQRYPTWLRGQVLFDGGRGAVALYRSNRFTQPSVCGIVHTPPLCPDPPLVP